MNKYIKIIKIFKSILFLWIYAVYLVIRWVHNDTIKNHRISYIIIGIIILFTSLGIDKVIHRYEIRNRKQ